MTGDETGVVAVVVVDSDDADKMLPSLFDRECLERLEGNSDDEERPDYEYRGIETENVESLSPQDLTEPS